MAGIQISCGNVLVEVQARNYPRVNTAPHCAQNFALSRSSAWHCPQTRRDESIGAGAMLATTAGTGVGTGEIGIWSPRPSEVAGTASDEGAAIGAGAAIPSRPAICSASAQVL